VREAREASAPVDVDEYVKSKVDALGEYAFDYTLDAYIKLQD
jgi:hypothetical protein